MHQGNIFGFSSDEQQFQREQQDVERQNRRSDKLRVQSGFDAAAIAAGHSLVAIEEEAEEEASIYGAPVAAGATNNMLLEMFNYAGHADVLAAAGHETSNPSAGYHRLIQHIRPDFYGGNNRPQGLVMSSTVAADIVNTSNWSSSVIHEDASALVAKQHGMNPAADSSSSSSTAMRLFFMNQPQAAAMQPDHRRSSASPDHPHRSPMGPDTLLHHHHDVQSQAFLGGGAGASIFGEGISFGGGGGGGGGMREGQLGPLLSLSSSLQQLEMRKADELRGVRSQGSAAAFLFYNNQQQQEQQLHPTSIQQPTPPPPPPTAVLQSQASHQSQGQYQQLHMSPSTFGSMSAANVLRNSKYSRAAQELLEEFCSVSRGHVRGKTTGIRNSSVNPTNHSHGGGGTSSSAAPAAASSFSSKDVPPLSPADRFENQRKKSKLLSMLDEVERRYNHYCEQMQMVVNSFDSVMGFGAAMPYTALARKAMSRHFRCLKDAIAAQLKRTCELLGDNDGGSGSGLTKGDTPKLRLIDQNLRQQKAFHQMGMMEQEAWRPQRGLPDRSVTILRSWLFEHFLHPYPSDADKHLLARKTGLSRNQVSNWFINARVRLWKPMVEDMYQQETKEEEEDSRINADHETNMTPHRVLLAAALTAQQRHLPHSPESGTQTHHDQPPPPPHDLTASTNSLIFPPSALDEEMYRRAAAAAAARSGDLSLTLGLRHAGGNAPDTAGRFGL